MTGYWAPVSVMFLLVLYYFLISQCNYISPTLSFLQIPSYTSPHSSWNMCPLFLLIVLAFLYVYTNTLEYKLFMQCYFRADHLALDDQFVCSCLGNSTSSTNSCLQLSIDCRVKALWHFPIYFDISVAVILAQLMFEHPDFQWMLGFQIWFLLLVWQILYWLRHFLRPWFF